MPSEDEILLSQQWEKVAKAVIPKALEIAAQTTAAIAEQFIPVKENALRNSKEIDVSKDGVELNYGDKLDYARNQYYGPVNHLTDSSGRPIRMVNYLPSRKRSGRGQKAYNDAYKAASEAKALTKFTEGGANDPRWIHRTIEDGRSANKIVTAFIKALKGT